MADNKDLQHGYETLAPKDKIRYYEIQSGVYVPVVAALLVGEESGTEQELLQDGRCGSLVVLQRGVYNVQVGRQFECGYYDSNVGNNATISLLLITQTKNVHLVWQAAAGGDAVLRVYENPTITDVGTAITVFNVNRRSASTPSILAYHTPTVVGGLLFPEVLLPGGERNRAAGSAGDSLSELHIRVNTPYYIELTNISGGTQECNILTSWCEEIPADNV